MTTQSEVPEGYLDLDSMSPREKWAAGRLAEMFFNNGCLFDVTAKRNKAGKDFLVSQGYSEKDAERLTTHVDAATALMQGFSEQKRTIIIQEVQASIAENRHACPPPPEEVLAPNA